MKKFVEWPWIFACAATFQFVLSGAGCAMVGDGEDDTDESDTSDSETESPASTDSTTDTTTDFQTDDTSDCGTVSTTMAIVGGGKTFGECMNDCNQLFSVQPQTQGECATATLSTCGNELSACSTVSGQFTPAGNARLTGLAAELVGKSLDTTYGCPDCADGGAGHLKLILDGDSVEISYEYDNPPEILVKADEFVMSVVSALYQCQSNDNITVATATCASATAK